MGVIVVWPISAGIEIHTCMWVDIIIHSHGRGLILEGTLLRDTTIFSLISHQFCGLVISAKESGQHFVSLK